MSSLMVGKIPISGNGISIQLGDPLRSHSRHRSSGSLASSVHASSNPARRGVVQDCFSTAAMSSVMRVLAKCPLTQVDGLLRLGG